jgi:hypothetical protein
MVQQSHNFAPIGGKNAPTEFTTIPQREFAARVLANQRQLTSNIKATYEFGTSGINIAAVNSVHDDGTFKGFCHFSSD